MSIERQSLQSLPNPEIRKETDPEAESAFLKKIPEQIEVDKDFNPQHPKLRASEYGLSQLQRLNEGLRMERKQEQPTVIGIVRCWNKSPEQVKAFVERAKRLKATIPQLAGIILSINQEGENGEGITEASLKSLDVSGETQDTGVPIIPLAIEKYTWTSGLNGPLAMVNEMVLHNGIKQKDVRIMNISFDAEVSEENLEKVQALTQERRLVFTVRQTGEQQSPSEDILDPSKAWERCKEILRNPLGADLTELSYIFRNTFNIFNLSDLVSMGGFNPLCNGDIRKFSSAQPSPLGFYQYKPQDVQLSVHGMEDAELLLRMIMRAKHSRDTGFFREIYDALQTPVFYRDMQWEKADELTKMKKIGNEMNALSKILSGLASSEYRPAQGGGKFVATLRPDQSLPPTMQDFRLRKGL